MGVQDYRNDGFPIILSDLSVTFLLDGWYFVVLFYVLRTRNQRRDNVEFEELTFMTLMTDNVDYLILLNLTQQ